MKKLSKVLLLIGIAAGFSLSAPAQSTQGKDFWVSSTLVCSPDKAAITPYIAVSAEKACTVHITGGVGNAINITQQVAAGSWNEFGNGTTSQLNPNAGMIKVPMDATKWYPTTMVDASSVYTLAGQKNQYGLHITATEDVSVYVILSAKNSMDASNILPITAIGSEYYTQDYSPEANDSFSGNMVSMTTILGTENGTTVEIIPNGDTYDNHVSKQLYTITLDQGQTYYLISKKEQQLSGTHITAKNGKKIAVYNGAALTRIPNGLAARDCLFEQSMPIEYWGTQFVVTRSLEKDGNLIGITATQPGTEIKVDGYTQAYINEGETYYIMLQGINDPYSACLSKITSQIDQVITADAAYIETSCPCAVYNYDTGRNFKGKNGTELNGTHGDPSSVWVSPIQQKINKITFGTCYTNMTEDHFLNVVTETATCQQTKLTALYGATQLDKSNLLTWTPLPGNPTYSYARAKIGDSSTKNYSVFRLENPKGVIATVYGNGDDESYAYSAGSAAVEQGVNVDGETFTNGYRSDNKYCLNNDLAFDAKVGTDEITRVDWTFGDGTTEYYGNPQTTHHYTTPGWFDVTADLYGHQICTNEDNIWLGKVQFTFRVVRPDTLYTQPDHHCISIDSIYNGQKLTAEEITRLLTYGDNDTTQIDCASNVYITPVSFGIDTKEILDTIVGQDQATGYNGKVYYASEDVSDTIYPLANSKKCLVIREYHVKVITCLDIQVINDSAAQHLCPPQNLNIEYSKTKGDIKGARFIIPGEVDDTVLISNAHTLMGNIELPTAALSKPGKYKGQLIVEDMYCETKTFYIDIAVYYPSDIFRYKFNNVLAVYNNGYGGNDGYEFKGYQWYRNGQPIEGATEPVLYLGDGVTFDIGDDVYVELTNLSGQTLPSCSQKINTVPDYTATEMDKAQVRKILINNHFVIMRGNGTYDIYGQKVK